MSEHEGQDHEEEPQVAYDVRVEQKDISGSVCCHRFSNAPWLIFGKKDRDLLATHIILILL
jgi:hypothetical protein